MEFALSAKTPGPDGRLPGVSRKEFDTIVRETLLKMLNISHTHQTLVGNEFVRGVSGGERKRVSIAEMMATRARVQCWDNSTRGLDASTALDFAKSLRIMTDVLGQTTFVSLYVPRDRILMFINPFFSGTKPARAFTNCLTRSLYWTRAARFTLDPPRKHARTLRVSAIDPFPARAHPTI